MRALGPYENKTISTKLLSLLPESTGRFTTRADSILHLPTDKLMHQTVDHCMGRYDNSISSAFVTQCLSTTCISSFGCVVMPLHLPTGGRPAPIDTKGRRDTGQSSQLADPICRRLDDLSTIVWHGKLDRHPFIPPLRTCDFVVEPRASDRHLRRYQRTNRHCGCGYGFSFSDDGEGASCVG